MSSQGPLDLFESGVWTLNDSVWGNVTSTATCDVTDINVYDEAEASGELVIHRTAYMTGAWLRARDKVWKL